MMAQMPSAPRARPLRASELLVARTLAAASLEAGYSAKQTARLLAHEGFVSSPSTGERIALRILDEQRAARRAAAIERHGLLVVARIDDVMAQLDTQGADVAPDHRKAA